MFMRLFVSPVIFITVLSSAKAVEITAFAGGSNNIHRRKFSNKLDDDVCALYIGMFCLTKLLISEKFYNIL